MFKATIILTSLALPAPQIPRIQNPCAVNWGFYINAPQERPVFPRRDSLFDTRPIGNDDLIKEGMEDLYYRSIIERLEP